MPASTAARLIAALPHRVAAVVTARFDEDIIAADVFRLRDGLTIESLTPTILSGVPDDELDAFEGYLATLSVHVGEPDIDGVAYVRNTVRNAWDRDTAHLLDDGRIAFVDAVSGGVSVWTEAELGAEPEAPRVSDLRERAEAPSQRCLWIGEEVCEATVLKALLAGWTPKEITRHLAESAGLDRKALRTLLRDLLVPAVNVWPETGDGVDWTFKDGALWCRARFRVEIPAGEVGDGVVEVDTTIAHATVHGVMAYDEAAGRWRCRWDSMSGLDEVDGVVGALAEAVGLAPGRLLWDDVLVPCDGGVDKIVAHLGDDPDDTPVGVGVIVCGRTDDDRSLHDTLVATTRDAMVRIVDRDLNPRTHRPGLLTGFEAQRGELGTRVRINVFMHDGSDDRFLFVFDSVEALPEELQKRAIDTPIV